MSIPKKEKTNIDYLRHILDTLGNLIGENNYKESIEWLDSIQAELDVAKEKAEAAERLATDKEDEVTTLEDDISNLKTELKEKVEQADYEDTINTQMGNGENIRWEAPNLACKTMMEELGEAIGRGVQVQKIENVLRAL